MRRAKCPSGSAGSSIRPRRQWCSAFSSQARCGSNSKYRFMQTDDSGRVGQRKFGVTLDGDRQVFDGASGAFLAGRSNSRGDRTRIRQTLRGRCCNGHETLAQLDENRLCSDSTTRRPISSCTSNTFSIVEVMFFGKGDLLRHAIEELHRDAPVCAQSSGHSPARRGAPPDRDRCARGRSRQRS